MADRRRGTLAQDTREARLKAALKANIARRKARAQAVEQPGDPARQGEPPESISEEE